MHLYDRQQLPDWMAKLPERLDALRRQKVARCQSSSMRHLHRGSGPFCRGGDRCLTVVVVSQRMEGEKFLQQVAERRVQFGLWHA